MFFDDFPLTGFFFEAMHSDMPNQQPKEPRINISLTGDDVTMMMHVKEMLEQKARIKLKWPQVIKLLIDNQAKI